MGYAAIKMSSKADELILQYQKYVHAIAKRMIAGYSLPAENLDEMISAGYLGLVEAAGRYDSNTGSSFKSFAFLRIRGAIIDSIRSNSEITGKAYRLAKAWSAIQQIEESLGSELDQENEPEQLLANVLEFAASGALAFKLSLSDFEEEAADFSGLNHNQEDCLVSSEEKKIIRQLVRKLPEKERFIIESYYFEEKTLSEITLLLGDHSKGWISRLHVKALSRLKYLVSAHRRASHV